MFDTDGLVRVIQHLWGAQCFRTRVEDVLREDAVSTLGYGRSHSRKVFMIRTFLLSGLLLLLVVEGIAAPAQPSRDVFGLRLGMNEETVHKRMRKISTQQKEEREEEEGGEQEIWILKKDPRYQYVLTKFSREHRLILVTVMAQPNRVKYSDLGDVKSATVASDGMNYSYKWKLPAQRKESALMVIARGGNADYLTSYSIYASR